MAYAAVLSLKQTIDRLLNSTEFLIHFSGRIVLQSTHEEVISLLRVLMEFNDGRFRSSRRLDALDGEIRDAVRELEDVLDQSHVPVDLLPSQSAHLGYPQIFSLDMEGARRDQISSFADAARKMKKDYTKELKKALVKQEDDGVSSSSIDFGGVEMVGFSNEFTSLKTHVLNYTRPFDFVVFSLVGRPGSGRTIDANMIFEKLCKEEKRFDCGAWVSVGRKYEVTDILATILAQIQIDGENTELIGDEQLNTGEYLHGCLMDRMYMIVLDDVCDTHLWDLLKTFFPEQNNGSMVMLTTSFMEVALSANSSNIRPIYTYDEEHSWHMIQFWIDNDELIMTPEMEEAGRKIAKNCRGLYFPLTRVGSLLAGADKTPEYWKELAADEDNPIFTVSDELSELHEICDAMKTGYWQVTESRKVSIDIHAIAMERELFPYMILSGMEVIEVFGMPGVGKTTIVKKIFNDPSISCHFDHCVWVTLGPKYPIEEILVDMLAQIYPNEDRRHIKEDTTLSKYLCEDSSIKRCLIVLDDIWTSEPLHYLKKALRRVNGKVILTTRIKYLEPIFPTYHTLQQVCLLSKKESWQLFCQKVFNDGSCPPELEKAGQMISANCEGLPLLILTIADILTKEEKTQEYWNKVANNQTLVFREACNKLSNILLPSYQSLPQHLKGCFLYMGVFAQKYEISTNNLINYWIVECLIESKVIQNSEDLAMQCLTDIAENSLAMVLQQDSNQGIKTSVLHCVFWYLSNSEAAKTKFFLAMSKLSDFAVEDRNGQRRLCIRNSVLFSIKDVHTSLASFSSARSLICTGPRHPYPVPIYFGLRLLRVLSARTIRFYEFPTEVVKLIRLRYLSVICSTKLPAFISKLQNLQFLIVDPHLRMKSFDDSSSMPKEIWDMRELKHLQIKGRSLPDPKQGTFLPNLSTLLDVCADSCTEKVLKGIPNLKRLRIQIELGPDGNGKLFHCLNNISNLRGLKSLKCVVIDPQFGLKDVIPHAPVTMFPSSLKELTLAGLGYPWEYTSIIGNLNNLKVLKLQCYAFRGPVWDVEEREFLKLEYLLIEDADLVCWRKRRVCFSKLTHLSIRHCYKLQELPSYFRNQLETIELVNNNPLVDTWAERIKERGPIAYDFALQVHSLIDAANQEH